MLRHAEEAAEVLRKRQADAEAVEKRKRDEAEAVMHDYCLAETYHPEAAEKLADALVILGWNYGVMATEAKLTDELPAAFKELDTLEYRYREAAEHLKERQAYWSQRRGSMNGADERKMNYELNVGAKAVETCEEAHERRHKRLRESLGKSRYRRTVPPRYSLPLKPLLASAHPPAKLPEEERCKPAPIKLPERPHYMDTYTKAMEAAAAAERQIYRQAEDDWNAAVKQVEAEHEQTLAAGKQKRSGESDASSRKAKVSPDIESPNKGAQIKGQSVADASA